MTFSVPSFLAAETSADIPPPAAADVAADQPTARPDGDPADGDPADADPAGGVPAGGDAEPRDPGCGPAGEEQPATASAMTPVPAMSSLGDNFMRPHPDLRARVPRRVTSSWSPAGDQGVKGAPRGQGSLRAGTAPGPVRRIAASGRAACACAPRRGAS